MKNCYIILFLYILLSACSSEEQDALALPVCIEELIAKNELFEVKAQVLNGEQHYLLEGNFGVLSGYAPIVNNDCIEVCELRQIPADCFFEYGQDSWQTLWTNDE